VYFVKLPDRSRLARMALALVMGGALGNLIDRARLGSVIDFVDVFWGPHHWPAFNVADSAISVGVVLLVLDMLRAPRAVQKDAEAGLPVRAATNGGNE
jgi:signal peptidase II